MAYSLVKENEGWNTWNSHVTGATALLKMRDVKGAMTPLTLELVWTVKIHLVRLILFASLIRSVS